MDNYYAKGNFIVRGRLPQTIFRNNLTRGLFYVITSVITFTLLMINRLLFRQTKTYKYKLSACLIFKNESDFLDEWIKYHLVIGVEHFYLYNNNSDDDYLAVLSPYIEKGIVNLIDWPKPHSQMLAYRDCYLRCREETNWLTFIDVDEFICPITYENVQQWLNGFRSYPGIAVYWKQFGSNGILKHDYHNLVIEQYTQCWGKSSSYSKMFCNMDFEIHEFNNPHIIKSKVLGVNLSPINQYRKLMGMGVNRKGSYKHQIQINHYWGKAHDCFVKNKIQRTDVYHANDEKLAKTRENLLQSHEAMCTQRDYTIQRFLLATKLRR